MFTFPTSLYGSLFQYPTRRKASFATQVLQFMGGKEQRYGLSGDPLHRWEVKPVLITDEAMGQLGAFFYLVGGTAQAFRFADPWSGDLYPFCYFESDSLEHELSAEGRNAVAFAILEGKEPL